MRKIVFTEEFCNPGNLFPFTLTRQVQDIRVGILTIRKKWEKHLGLLSFDKFEDDYKDLDRSIRLHEAIGKDTVYLVHGNVLPTKKLIKQVKKLRAGEALSLPDFESVVYCISSSEIVDAHNIKVGKAVEMKDELKELKAPWNIFQYNAWAIAEDFELLTAGRKSAKLSATNNAVNQSNIFIEKGAIVECSFLNATEGPIYIGKGAVIMEGSMLRGPVAVCDGAVVKMGTRIYGGTTIGPKCTVGGGDKRFGNVWFRQQGTRWLYGRLGDWRVVQLGRGHIKFKHQKQCVGCACLDACRRGKCWVEVWRIYGRLHPHRHQYVHQHRHHHRRLRQHFWQWPHA